ncbi:MAG: hypothetical protein HGA67_00130 [Candidatus Yonathbacteria bacterium]|nr:hypothetical protein [Candidatus Yonathbacteria bacterium]
MKKYYHIGIPQSSQKEEYRRYFEGILPVTFLVEHICGDVKCIFGKIEENSIDSMFTKWGGNIAMVFLAAVIGEMPIRVSLSSRSDDEVCFSVQFAPNTCVLSDAFPSEWVAEFFFYKTQMSFMAHDNDAVKYNAELVDCSFPRDMFYDNCIEVLRAMYSLYGIRAVC